MSASITNKKTAVKDNTNTTVDLPAVEINKFDPLVILFTPSCLGENLIVFVIVYFNGLDRA